MKNVSFLAFMAVVAFFSLAKGTGAYAAECPQLKAEDLFKVPSQPAVYALNSSLKRMYFPNSEVFYSWYDGFWNVQTIPEACVDQYPSGGGINYRPGSRLIKTTLSPVVYAIGPGNTLERVDTEAIARQLYGGEWTKLIRDVSDIFFVNYHRGASLIVPEPHDGQLIQRAGGDTVYYVEGGHLFPVSDTLANGPRADVRVVSDEVLKKLPMAGIAERAEDVVANPPQDRVYKKVIVQNTPLELSGDTVLELVDTHLIIGNKIVLSDRSRLVLKNSFIDHRQDYSFQYSLTARNTARVVITDSRVGNTCNGSLNWNFYDDSALVANGVDIPGCTIWNFLTDRAHASVTRWDRFGASTCEYSETMLRDSKDAQISLCNGANALVDETLPTSTDHFAFPNANEKNIFSKLDISTSSIAGWSVDVKPGSDVTIWNSSHVGVNVIVGWPWKNQTVTLDNLSQGNYADKTWAIGPDAKLHFINVDVSGWEPNVWNDNTLVIKNATYAGSSVNGGMGKYVIDNVIAGTMRTTENVTMIIKNSTINGDVIAVDDSRITLVNTVVNGKIIQKDHGRVIIQSPPKK